MSRFKTTPVSAEEALARARSMLGQGAYVLGAGGFDPSHDDPQSRHWQHDRFGVDCSGFVCWSWGVSRVQRDERRQFVYLNTTFMVQDARGSAKYFERVDVPAVGDGIVFPWRKGKDGKQKIGHVGIVSATNGGMRSIFERIRVIHASAGNQRRFGYAIAETDAGAWNHGKDTIFVRIKR